MLKAFTHDFTTLTCGDALTGEAFTIQTVAPGGGGGDLEDTLANPP